MKKFRVVIGLKDGTWERVEVSASTRAFAVEKVCAKYKEQVEFVCGVECLNEES